MAKTKGIFMGSSYENTIKKAMKILWKITINGPWNSLDYKKCNEKHMKKPWLF